MATPTWARQTLSGCARRRGPATIRIGDSLFGIFPLLQRPCWLDRSDRQAGLALAAEDDEVRFQPTHGRKQALRISIYQAALPFRLIEQDREQGGAVDHHYLGTPNSS